jgi:hypothetical protein
MKHSGIGCYITVRKVLVVPKCICFERRKIVESSIEIRELESKLKMAYILKERKKQLDEKESIRVMEKVCK